MNIFIPNRAYTGLIYKIKDWYICHWTAWNERTACHVKRWSDYVTVFC